MENSTFCVKDLQLLEPVGVIKLKDDKHYTGYFINNDSISITFEPLGSLRQIQHFYLNHGIYITFNEVKELTIPTFELTWDPFSSIFVPAINAQDNPKINSYRPSEFAARFANGERSSEAFPLIAELINNVFMNETDTIHHFYNWVSCMLRTSDRCNSAWLLQGSTGTGKSVLANLLAEFIGAENSTSTRIEKFFEDKDGFLKNKQFIIIEEIYLDRIALARVDSKFKDIITENKIGIREMRVDTTAHRNRINVLATTNRRTALYLEASDRRWNISPYQEQKLRFANDPQSFIQFEQEKWPFFCYLMQVEHSKQQAAIPIINEAKKQMIVNNTSEIQATCDALLNGDLKFFIDEMDVINVYANQEAIKNFRRLFEDIKFDPIRYSELTRDEIETIFRVIASNSKIPSGKAFVRMLGKYGLYLSSIWNKRFGCSKRGMKVLWVYDK